jgi:DNA-binding NtrC family response regulator
MTSATKILWVTQSGESGGQIGGIAVERAASGAEALQKLQQGSYDALLIEAPLEDCEPEELLEETRRIDASILFCAHLTAQAPDHGFDEAVRLTRWGADHVFSGVLDSAEVASQLETLIESRRTAGLSSLAAAMPTWRRLLVGESRAMENVLHTIHLIGQRRCTVLVTGETGTGKEMVARAVHLASGRANLPMVAVNCSALPENLLEAELFGHVKGAFTGATNLRIGRFEQAHRSTIFLDEIGDMPMELQAKLLRVLQEREFQRVGSSDTIRIDVRVVAASNCDLIERVRQGRFREDLYYRLNVVPIRTPPLRERRGDIPVLARHFVDKICRMEQIPLKRITPEALARLAAYTWPGNVRQLENSVEQAVALSGERPVLTPMDFPLPAAEPRVLPVNAAGPALPDGGLDFEQTVNEFERSILAQALERTSGNKKQAADMLRLKRTTLSAKLRTLGASA